MQIEVSGSTVTSYWATKEGAPVIHHRFAIEEAMQIIRTHLERIFLGSIPVFLQAQVQAVALEVRSSGNIKVVLQDRSRLFNR